jgi:hypothetical protein
MVISFDLLVLLFIIIYYLLICNFLNLVVMCSTGWHEFLFIIVLVVAGFRYIPISMLSCLSDMFIFR